MLSQRETERIYTQEGEVATAGGQHTAEENQNNKTREAKPETTHTRREIAKIKQEA